MMMFSTQPVHNMISCLLRLLKRAMPLVSIVAITIALLATIAVAGILIVLERQGRAPVDPAPYFLMNASSELHDRNGAMLYAFLSADEQWSFPRTLDEFSPWLIKATIAAEDQRFYSHAGVDYPAVARAVMQNLRGMGIASGASTLTMQLVKLSAPQESILPSSTRNLKGKWNQAVRALQLEHQADKDTILVAYLNKAPYGMNLVGAEAASRRYFGKSARHLTLEEAALLAGLPKAPSRYQPMTQPERARHRRDYVLHRMYRDGYITGDRLERALKQPIEAKWHDFPSHAPHLAHYYRSSIEQEGVRRTALDAQIQSYCERVVKQYMNTFAGEITNAAVMVASVESGEILARAGSADFFGTVIGGQVDLCRAPRAPGSTLKPFTYALAMERNRLYPSEQLLDGALDYGSYNPGNFDGLYNGLVTAAEALHYSLNIPAVMLLERIGVDSMLELLHHSGLTTLDRASEHYGLGLTLGNCEVRLEEMLAAYAAIANLGEYRPLRIWLDKPIPEVNGEASHRIMSKGTAQALYTMLEAPFPREQRRDLVRTQGVLPRVCWKTGTSTGYHDAWTFAFNRQYVVGVWLGNNDARASKRLIGAEAALPLVARIFRALPNTGSPFWPQMDAMRAVRVCTESGLPSSPWCEHTLETMIPAEQFINRRCAVHYPTKDGEVARRWPGTPRQWDLARIVEPVQVSWGDSNSEPRIKSEEQDVSEQLVSTRKAATLHQETLKITSPPAEATYVYTQVKNGDMVELTASGQGSTPLHWYLNDHYLGQSTLSNPLYMPLTPGNHKLTCFSMTGHTDQIHFEVVKSQDSV